MFGPNSFLGGFLRDSYDIRLNSCIFGTKFIIKKVSPYSQECPRIVLRMTTNIIRLPELSRTLHVTCLNVGHLM